MLSIIRKFLVAFLCVAVCAVGAHYNRDQSSRRAYLGTRTGYLTKKQILAPTDNAAATQYGVKVPPTSCLLTWDEFNQHVINTDWLGIYAIEDDQEEFPEVTYKYKVIWSNEGENVRRKGTYLFAMRGDADSSQCFFLDGVFAKDSTTHVVLRSTGDGDFASEGRKDYFFSCDPSRYIIFFVCYEAAVNGRCPSSNVFLLVPDVRPAHPGGDLQRQGDINLDNVPWLKIESTFKTCIDQLFVDSTEPRLEWVWQGNGKYNTEPRLEWEWQGNECPHPNSMAAGDL